VGCYARLMWYRPEFISIFGELPYGVWKCEFADLEIRTNHNQFYNTNDIFVVSNSYALCQIWLDLLKSEPLYFIDCDEFKQIT
jgi:hypothetical protein